MEQKSVTLGLNGNGPARGTPSRTLQRARSCPLLGLEEHSPRIAQSPHSGRLPPVPPALLSPRPLSSSEGSKMPLDGQLDTSWTDALEFDESEIDIIDQYESHFNPSIQGLDSSLHLNQDMDEDQDLIQYQQDHIDHPPHIDHHEHIDLDDDMDHFAFELDKLEKVGQSGYPDLINRKQGFNSYQPLKRPSEGYKSNDQSPTKKIKSENILRFNKPYAIPPQFPFLQLPKDIIIKIIQCCPEETHFTLERVSHPLSQIINLNVFGLTKKQTQVKAYVKAKKNIFFTGSAGTGKSFLLMHLVKYLKSLYVNEQEFLSEVAITAPSGIAACNIGGQTTFRWAGIQRGENASQMNKAWRNDKRNTWMNVKILLIDEISFLSCNLFHRLEAFARKVRGNNRPFGGIQLILAGDFLQLPPIKKPIPENFYFQFLDTPKNIQQSTFNLIEWRYRNKMFAFEAEYWKEVIGDNIVVLDDIFRQNDKDFIQILNEVREGRCTRESMAILDKMRHNILDEANTIKIFPTNKRVDVHNLKELEKLSTPEQTYQAVDLITRFWNESSVHYIVHQQRTNELYTLLKPLLAKTEVILKVHCKVILLSNLDERYFNGRVGSVVGWRPWNQLMAERYSSWCAINPLIPLVKFNDTIVPIGPVAFKSSTRFGCAKRIQIPLKLAYAITTHKCQGMQFQSAEIAIDDCFSSGQAYVALSRVKELKGLKMNGTNPPKITASNAALRFYSSISQFPKPENLKQVFSKK